MSDELEDVIDTFLNFNNKRTLSFIRNQYAPLGF
jgi:hypothetical protein